MQFSPTPPQPNTATDAPGSTRAVLITAPTPVSTPQPISAAWASGTDLSIGITTSCGTTVAVLNVPSPSSFRIVRSLPASRGKVVSSGISSHRFG